MLITENSVVKVQGKSGQGGGTSIVLLSGEAGGATVTLGYYDHANAFIPLTDGLLSAGAQYQVDHGSDVPMYAQISGATGTTSLSLMVNGKA